MPKVLLSFALVVTLTASVAAQTARVLVNHRRAGNFTFKIVDLNTAPIDMLIRLPHVDYWMAQRIVAGRPYRAVDELAQRGIVSSDIYNTLRDRVMVNRTP